MASETHGTSHHQSRAPARPGTAPSPERCWVPEKNRQTAPDLHRLGEHLAGDLSAGGRPPRPLGKLIENAIYPVPGTDTRGE